MNPNLNRRITIQSQSASQDDLGQPAETWTAVHSCWAEIDVQGSQLLYSVAEFISKATYRITIRWTRSVLLKPNMRIVYTEPFTGLNHTYEIEAILNPKQANQWLVLLAYELDGAA